MSDFLTAAQVAKVLKLDVTVIRKRMCRGDYKTAKKRLVPDHAQRRRLTWTMDRAEVMAAKNGR